MERIRVDYIPKKGLRPTKSLILEAFKKVEGNPKYHFVKPFREVVDTVNASLKLQYADDATSWKASLTLVEGNVSNTVTLECAPETDELMSLIVTLAVGVGLLKEEVLTDIDAFI